MLDSLPLNSKDEEGTALKLAVQNYFMERPDDLLLSACRMSFESTKIMGILNVTPDSFSDGGRYLTADAAVEHAMRMIEEGADMIDIGGESTRPGSASLSIDEEIQRVELPIRQLSSIGVPISVDTMKPEVAAAAIKAGASMINDVNGLRDSRMVDLAAETGVPVVIMHMRGMPRTMQRDIAYDDVVGEVMSFLNERTKNAIDHGIARNKIILDPGIGFGKGLQHNLEILSRISEFRSLGHPILVGASRKTFIGKLTGEQVPDKRLEGSLAVVSSSIMNGVDIVRVHDVAETVRTVRMIDAIHSWPRHT